MAFLPLQNPKNPGIRPGLGIFVGDVFTTPLVHHFFTIELLGGIHSCDKWDKHV